MYVIRPRVATIGLNQSQIESIRSLCGTLRTADSVESYVKEFSWTETDILIGVSLDGREVENSVHVLAIEPAHWFWGPVHPRVSKEFSEVLDLAYFYPYMRLDSTNTEREVDVSSGCPEAYQTLAGDLGSNLRRAGQPPPTFKLSSRVDALHLLQTTSGQPVATRCSHIIKPEQGGDDQAEFVLVALPRMENLSEWFHAFLLDINTFDKFSVPHPPPRLSRPWNWYTPRERELAKQIKNLKSDRATLENQLVRVKAELESATTKADAEQRRVLGAYGDDLVDGVKEILTEFGFSVEDMDAALGPKDARREDLRLTLDYSPGWEAIVEVKGYKRGTKTSDSRQIRQFRDDYVKEKGRLPDLTLWIANPFRLTDPSVRPPPDGEVTNASKNIGAVVVFVPDLFRLWVLVAEGRVKPSEAAQRLVNAEAGLWDPGNLGL